MIMTTNDALREEIRSGLQASLSPETLLEIVRQHRARGMNQRAIYDTLEEIWRELGFHDDESPLGCEPNPRRETLQQIMDVVWGYCSRGSGIWDSSLNDEPRS